MARPTHGMSKTPEYKAWAGMITRCDPTTAADHMRKHYADRGIRIFPELRTFEGFYAVLGPKPAGKNISLDRIDVNDHYRAGNVRWADARTQARNRRTSRLLTYQGDTLSIVEWSEKLSIPYSRLLARLSRTGWSIEQSLTSRRYGSRSPRKLTKRSRILACNFVIATVQEWAAALKISESVIRKRLKNGWSVEEALYSPVDKSHHHK